MTLTQILGFLAPFEPILKREMLTLEASGKAELDKLVADVSSPDLKLLLGALAGAIDAFAQAEINKLG